MKARTCTDLPARRAFGHCRDGSPATHRVPIQRAATVMEIAYGHRVTSDDDSYVDISERAMRAAASSGRLAQQFACTAEYNSPCTQRWKYAGGRLSYPYVTDTMLSSPLS